MTSGTLSLPDLTPTAISLPGTIRTGETVTINWTVENSGTETVVTNWSERIVYSADAVLGNGDDVVITTQSITADLAVGATVDRSFEWVTPVLVDGSYTVFVVVDRTNAVHEGDETNNSTSTTFSATTDLPPVDLVVTSVTGPANALTGETISVSWTIENQGSNTLTAGAWTDRIYLSTTGTVNGSAVLLGPVARSATIGSGGSASFSSNFTIPVNLAAGNFQIVVVADALNTIVEAGAENNNTTASDPLAIGLGPVADLVVTAIDADTSTVPGGQLSVTWTIQNNGTASAASPWTDRVYFSADGNLTGATLLGAASQSSALASGNSREMIMSFSVPASAVPGDYFIILVTDFGNAVYERDNENNNQLADADSFTIEGLDLLVANLVVPSEASSGDTISVVWEDRNDGGAPIDGSWSDQVYISADNVLDEEDTLLGTLAIASPLGAGASAARNLEVTLPEGISGEFFIIVVADGLDQVVETDGEDNNTAATALPIALAPYADLTVTSVGIPTRVIGNPADMAVSWTVENRGTGMGDSTTWTDA
ncbi:MAG: hypothetical protein KJT03_07260, partial [Verrucomicrobiae bacterium]|nr:hypothetical protein [Verrucomicrobiae bacterium]